MQLTEAEADLRTRLAERPQWDRRGPMGVAVSGGGDSVALLHLMTDCARKHGVSLRAVSVDHGLRPEAADEAAFVAETCAGLGVVHDILRWQGWDGRGNLQAEARKARYRLMADWGRAAGVHLIATGHTRDDQAETFVMRLGRAAGVDGLSAMRPVFDPLARERAPGQPGSPDFWRPLLGETRAALRGYLGRRGLTWHEDPSNDDTRFDRVRSRQALAVLGDLGIGMDTLADVADHMADARAALNFAAAQVARDAARIDRGDVIFSPRLRLAPRELRRRLLVAALRWVGATAYAPRREAVAETERLVRAVGTMTLNGCTVTSRQDEIRISREYNAVKGLVAAPGGLWDGRWRLTAPGAEAAEGLEFRALGDALKDCSDWRETGLPRATLLASPAVWQRDQLVAAPLAGLGAGYTAEIDHLRGDFFTSLLSH